MKFKKQIRFLCLLMLSMMLTGILQPAAADVRAEQLLKEMGELTQIPETNLLIAQESKNKKWGIYDTEANIVVPLEHEKLSYLAYGMLSVRGIPEPEKPYHEFLPIPLEEINCYALMTVDGTVQTEYTYGGFNAYSPMWSVGWVLEEGTAEDNDYTPDKVHYFRIARCDVFFRDTAQDPETEEGKFHQAFSLTRDEFKDAKAHGEYLSIQNQENGVSVYNAQGEIVDIDVKNLKSSVYGIKNWMLLNLVTGEMLMDGCSAVNEAQTEDQLLLIAERIDFQGRKRNCLLTAKGDAVIPMCNGTISSVSRDYAIITSNENGKKGLYSFRENRLILPCAFDDILENKTACDPFNSHGFIVVMNEGLCYSYEIATGNLYPAVEVDESVKLQRYGAAFYTTQKTSKVTQTNVYSPDGNVKSFMGTIKKSRGSGYLLVIDFSTGTTVINWYGNNYLSQYYSDIIITDDDHFIVKTKKAGFELYRIPE